MRTDLTTYCPRCLVRFRPASRCPECDGVDVYDLTDLAVTETALDATQTAQTRHYEGQQLAEVLFNDWIGRAFAAFSIFSVIFLVLGASGMLAPGAALLVAAGGAFVLTIALSLGAAPTRSRPVHASRLPYNVQVLSSARNEPAVTTSAERLVIRGVVHAQKALTSPIEDRPCVAFVLAGDGVSDAAFIRFEVYVEGGGRALVEGPDATIELTTGPLALHPATPKLRELLRGRFVFRNPETLPLAEAVLVDGDVVEIEGSCRPHAEPELYRGTRWVKVFREEPGSPLIIRRPAAPSES